jgi:hypothetical protein
VRVLLQSSQATRLHAGLMTSVDDLETEEAPSANGAMTPSPVATGADVTDVVGDTPN